MKIILTSLFIALCLQGNGYSSSVENDLDLLRNRHIKAIQGACTENLNKLLDHYNDKRQDCLKKYDGLNIPKQIEGLRDAFLEKIDEKKKEAFVHLFIEHGKDDIENLLKLSFCDDFDAACKKEGILGCLSEALFSGLDGILKQREIYAKQLSFYSDLMLACENKNAHS